MVEQTGIHSKNDERARPHHFSGCSFQGTRHRRNSRTEFHSFLGRVGSYVCIYVAFYREKERTVWDIKTERKEDYGKRRVHKSNRLTNKSTRINSFDSVVTCWFRTVYHIFLWVSTSFYFSPFLRYTNSHSQNTCNNNNIQKERRQSTSRTHSCSSSRSTCCRHLKCRSASFVRDFCECSFTTAELFIQLWQDQLPKFIQRPPCLLSL